MGKSPNTKEYGAPGRYKDDSHHFYITVYTDYHYAITYICFDNNANEKCEHKEIQIEIWSKTPEFITETVMQDLKSIAADKLCINASDFVIIGIGICDPSKMLSPSTDQQKSNYCASLPCQHSGICAEEDGKISACVLQNILEFIVKSFVPLLPSQIQWHTLVLI